MRFIARTAPVLGLLVSAGCSPAHGQGPALPQPAVVGSQMARGASQDVAESQEAPRTIVVTGTASLDVSTDRARVSLAVESREKTASEAAQANARAMSAVLAAMRSGGFEGLDIDTYGYSLSPVYTSVVQNGARVQRIEGYRVLNNVRATLTDMKAVGRLIDVATGAGANRVNGISFEASDIEPAQHRVLADAVRRARDQARTMADALDRELGPPLNVQGGAQRPSPRQDYVRLQAMAAEAETPIEAGDQTVSASVTITFLLGPEKGSR